MFAQLDASGTGWENWWERKRGRRDEEMGKHKKRKRNSDGGPVPPAPRPMPPSAATTFANEHITLRAADVATTIMTLNYLAARPELMQSKALRDLRAALHPIVEEQIKKYDPIDYATRVTAALRAGRGSDALLALQGMLARSQTARQGTVQRWVRDCDSIDDVGLRVRLLHAVLRAGKPIEGVEQADGDEMEAVQPAAAAAAASAGGEKNDDDEEGEEVQEEAENDDEEMDENEEEEKADEPGGEDSALGSASVIHLPAWSPEEEAATEGSIDVASAGAGVAASVSGASYSGVGWATSGSALAAHPEGLRLASEIGLRVVKTERGPDRQPPNNYDLNIWVCAADAGGLLESNAMRQAKQRSVRQGRKPPRLSAAECYCSRVHRTTSALPLHAPSRADGALWCGALSAGRPCAAWTCPECRAPS